MGTVFTGSLTRTVSADDRIPCLVPNHRDRSPCRTLAFRDGRAGYVAVDPESIRVPTRRLAKGSQPLHRVSASS